MIRAPVQRYTALAALEALVALSSGCTVETPPPQSTEPVRIVLFNSTGFDVRPNLYASGSAVDSSGLFVPANLRTDFTDRPFPELRPHETTSLTLECDEVRSLGSDAPVFFDSARLIATPSEDRVFLLRGTDFNCGDKLRLVYFSQAGEFRVRVETD